MIYAFNRICSRPDRPAILNQKPKLPGFSLEKVWHNFYRTLDDRVKVFAMVDGEIPEWLERDIHIVPMQDAGTDKKSFLETLRFIETLTLDPWDILYFVEDDALHWPGWVGILLEGFIEQSLAVDYVTLYDHPDKYTSEMYRELQSEILRTTSVWWRTTPSTTGNFACYARTLHAHLLIHQQVCLEPCAVEKGGGFSYDHLRFLKLKEVYGAVLISCIPGYCTSSDAGYLSPGRDWEQILQ